MFEKLQVRDQLSMSADIILAFCYKTTFAPLKFYKKTTERTTETIAFCFKNDLLSFPP